VLNKTRAMLHCFPGRVCDNCTVDDRHRIRIEYCVA
jgi:hypothetical protein